LMTPDDKTSACESELDEGVKSAKSLIQTFLQAIKSYRIYESEHPILPKFLERLRNDFEHYFKESDCFSLQVGERRLFYRGKPVYESQDVKESLSFLFFKDGVREIRFYKGLDIGEIGDFLAVIRRSDSVNRFEDDLVTLLWEKDFSHIHFTTADEYLELSLSGIPPREGALQAAGDFSEAAEGEGSWEKDGGSIRLEQVLHPSPGQSLVQACQLTPGEAEEISREAQKEQRSGLLIGDLIEILLHLGEDMDAYENMISYFERVIHSLLEQKKIEKVVVIFRQLHDTLESIALKDKQIFAIRRILETASGSKSIDLLRKSASGDEGLQADILLAYLSYVTNQAADPLCRSLVDSPSAMWTNAVSETITRLSRPDFEPLTRFLSSPEPALVLQVLAILTRIAEPAVVKYLAPLVGNRDIKVREQVLQMVGQFGAAGRDLVLRFLADPVPEIRAKASLALARIGHEWAVKPLLEVVLSDSFWKRPYDEKASFLRALGETGAKEVIPVLHTIAKKPRWFQRSKWKEMRPCAIHSLKLLEGGARVSRAEVKH
jgi:hypothetical protein